MSFDMSSSARTTETLTPNVLEVATMSSDTMRAIVRVTGVLTDDNVTLLSSALATHLRAGRRYLRIDLAAAGVSGHKALATLAEVHAGTTKLGGMLVFDHASANLAAALREHELFLSDRP